MSLTIQTAFEKLKLLKDKDIRDLAKKHNITVVKQGGGINKGWAGQAIENYLGLNTNSYQHPDLEDGELKTIPLKYSSKGKLNVKWPMSITNINEYNIVDTDFEDSILLKKMRKMLIAARISEFPNETNSIFYSAMVFDIYNCNETVYYQIEEDYELIKEIIIDYGFNSLSRKYGEYVHAGTKGKTRAFYATSKFLKEFVLPMF